MKKNYKIYVSITVFLALISIILWQFFYYNSLNENSLAYINQLSRLTGVGFLTSQHIHADFKIYVNGAMIDLNKIELQAPEFASLEFWSDANTSKFVHLHEGETNKDVMHVHATGISLAMFLRAVSGKISQSCVNFPKIISNREFCDEKNKTLRVFINGVKSNAPQDYEIKDMDKILISYGNDSDAQVSMQIKSIGNNACIQSGKC